VPGPYPDAMTTMNVSLSKALKEYVDEQAAEGGYRSSEYVRELILMDQQHTRLWQLLMTGAESPPVRVADAGYFEELRRLAVRTV